MRKSRIFHFCGERAATGHCRVFFLCLCFRHQGSAGSKYKKNAMWKSWRSFIGGGVQRMAGQNVDLPVPQVVETAGPSRHFATLGADRRPFCRCVFPRILAEVVEVWRRFHRNKRCNGPSYT